MADIQGTNGDDVIKGERGDDFIDGLDGNDRITDVWGNNTINGGAGNDRILASRGVDVVDGGSGSDRIWTRHGDDTATYRLSENLGAEDYYDGGHGTDTLRLVLTAEEAQDPAIQATIEALRSFIEDDPDPNNSGQQPTTFTFSKDGADADLTLRNFENLEIVIDDDELPSLSIDDPEVTEGDPGDNTTITFTVTRSGDNGAESTVDYAVLPGSATTPGDYGPPDPLTGTLTFAAGETEKTVTLDITEDDIPEQTESFTVELSAPTNAAITKAIGTGTILDDDQPGLSINDPEVTEGDPGDNTTITFTVTRSGDNGAESTVAYSVLPGTAGTPGDYGPPDPLTGTLTFAAGETEKTVTLDITEDDIPEQTESFTVELSAPTNAAITKAIGTGTILDDDQPGLSINDPEVTEGDPGDNTTITFTVTRSGDNGAESTVAYSVLPGTAGTPGDYGPPDPLTGTLTFAAGETEKTVTLDITEDDIPEQTESFTVELSAPTNAAITKAIGTGTILDDDQPGLSINDPEVTEGDPGDNTTITFTVTRSGDNGAESTVAYSVLPGTAGTPGDYGPPDPLTGTLTFAAGETEKTVTLDITEDDVPEETESFTVELSAPTNAAITKAIGTGTILDDDQPGLSINDPEVTEGDPGDNTTITFTVTRSGDNGAESTVAYSVLPGTAGTPGDYGPPDPLTGTLTFAAGETEKTVTLDITEDDIPEQTESFTVELSAPTNAAITKAIGTGTILDDDQPGLSINDPEVTEGDPGDNTTITFTVTRSGDNGAESTVAYSVLPGTAGTPGDYGPPDPLTGTLTFAAGETEKTITLDITEDDIPEQTESFTVELSAPTNAAITKAIGTGTILDDDQPGLSINDPEVTEGDPGDNTTITFTVTRSGDNGAESTVAYSVLPGTAGTPGDYGPPDPLTGTLTFAAGETEKTVTLDITEDDIPEQTESFTVELSAPTNAAITKAIGTGTILDDDQPGLSINDPEVTEGDPGDNTTITFTVTRSGDNGAESTVAYSVLPGTAGTPGDYGPPDPLTGTLTFAAGETEKTVTLDITEDDIPEQTESFTVELSAPTNAAITKAIGTGTILDDDQPGLSINDPEVTEGDPGDNTTITFTVTRSGDNGAESTVAYSVLPGTAGTPGDYGPPDPLTGTLTFAAGETEKTVTLDITEDDIPEQTESFTVELSAPTNAAITKAIGTGTILDDDQPGLSINDPEVTEGDPGDNTTITFTVTRSGDNGAESTVAYSVLPGTAGTPGDYGPPDPLTGTLTFAAGETEKTVTLDITEDDIPEQTESFTVELSAPTNAAITKAIGTGTILDDDQPGLSINDPEVTEGDPGDNTTITFTVTRSGDNGAESTVAYSVLPGTAGTPGDYGPPDPLTGTLTFAAGETEKTVTLDITEDDIPEQTESFTVELSAPTNAAITKAIGTGTILDDDQPGLSINDPEVTEGDPGDNTTITFTVTRSGDNGAESTVAYSVLPGTAGTPGDYGPPDPLTGTLTFAAGETEKTVTLDITEDDIPEQTESFTVELSAPTNAAITKAIGTGTILDDDQPGLSINDPEVTEGDPGDNTTITFTVTRSGDNGAESTVAYSVLPGTAGTPGDYGPPDPLTGTLTFAAGETEKTVTLDITEDDIPEQTESFTVELSAPTNAAITKAIGTGTILDDDQPGLSINDPEVTEGDPGDNTTITFTVTRSGDNGAESTVAYSVLPGTAGTPGDYGPPDPLTGTLTFAAGETEKTVTLDITEDDIPEQTESFTVELSAPTNAAITKAIGTGTILDDDQPGLSINDPEVTEGDPGDNTTITFTVTRSGDNGAESTVAYSVLPGTAGTPGDYGPPDPLTGTLTFAAGETEKTITLDITEDDIPEQTESFTVELSAPTNAAITKAIGTGTILDDDQPGLSINDPEVTEGDPGDNTTITFTVTRSGDNGAESTVAYSVLPGTAGTPGDYGPPDPLTGTLTFAAGETEKTVTLDITEDDVPEETESFTVELSAPTNAAITKAIGTGTILDDDQPGLSINDPEVTEGDPGDNTTITFTVTRSGDNGAESTVAYSVLPGTAGTPGDYGPPDPLTGTLTFAAGETEKTVTLDITEDDIPEQTESFTVELSAPTNAAITKAIGTGTILDDDQPGLSINDPEVTEGDPGDNTTITFTVTRSGDNGAESTVAYSVLPGTAGTPGDYGPPDPLTGTLTFAAGETEKTVTLDITEDDVPEETESFTVELSAPTNAAITKAIGTGTILDDDQPGLSINDPEVTEGDPGDNTTITFTVTRSGDNGAESTVAYSVLPGTAGTPGDYGPPDPLTGTLTFAAGETEKTVTLDITEDDVPEETESFTVELSAPTNAAITKAIGTGTILDDDQPGLSINDPEVTEGDPGDNTTITFTVTRSGDNGAESTVAYSVLPGTAGTPGDYGPPDPLTGTLTFAAGETEKTVTLDITEDDIPEQTESFTVELSAPTNAAITKAIGTGTILDDDQPGLSINDPEVTEGDPGDNTTITFTVTRSGDNGAESTVAYSVLPGTAGTPGDYGPPDPLTGTLTFAAGETEKTITLDITEDDIPEQTESFTVELSAPTNAAITKGIGTGTILDDDQPSLSDTVIWTSSDDSNALVGIGGSLNVGTDISAGTPTDHWTNSDGDRLWGTDANWEDGTKPILDDRVLFDEIDSGGTNFVSQNFTILSLYYTGAGSHITDVVNDSNLEITSSVGVGIDNPSSKGSLRIEDIEVTEVGGGINIGRKSLNTDTPVNGLLTLTIGSEFNAETSTGDVFIGFNGTNANSATGELNALESGATVNLDFDDLIVGHADGTGLAQGTLRWNQEEAIHANEVYFGLGSNATSVLDVPAGGTFRLGTDLDRAGFLNVAYNDTGAAGTLTAGLDFTVTNPTFEAYLDNTLTLGRKTIGATGDTDGTLTLGSNSTLDIQSVTGDVVIGFNQSNSDTVTGEFNALESGATVNLDIDNLFVGHAERTGTAQGTLRWNQEEAIHANGVWFGLGSNATSVLDVPAGGTFRLGTDLDRAGFLNVAYNDTGAAGTLTAGLDFTVTNPTFEAYLDNTLTLGRKTIGATGDTDGTLTLGSNSTLDILSGTGDVVIGFNQSNSDTVSGEFNALESGATVNLDFDDLIVGHAEGTGLAQGTLRWNQEEAIHANEVYFGRGSNATSVLDVPAGGTFRLGTDLDRAGFLNVAYNDTGAAGTLTAGLDFTVTNPTFEAYLDNTLTLGRKTIGATGDTDGTLTLGSNSTLDIQSVTGDVVIGFNQSNSDTVTGEFNALESGATVNLDIDNLFVGHAERTGTAQGTLRWNQEEAIHANGVWFGLGSNATSVLDVPAGGTFRLGTDLDRAGFLNVAYNDTGAAGTLTAGLDFTVTNPTFEAYLDNTLTLGRKTIGATGDTDGTLTLGSNSTLDILSGTGDVVIGFNQSNSDTVSGEFNALESGATVNLDFDDLIVGHAEGTGLAQGTLRWNQEEAIHANEVYFGRGSNATSVLDVPAGGTFRLGTDLDRAGFLNVAYNDTGAAGTLTAGLDFTVTNPTFEAYLDNTLTLGRKTIGATGDTDGTLTLGSNSTLDIQSVTGDVVIGFNQSNSDTVTGEFNALESGATVNLDIDNLFVGHAERTGTAQGTLRWNQEEAIHANGVWFGLGSNATSVLDVPAGGTLRLGTDIDRIGTLNVAYNDTSAAGTLTAGLDFTVTNPTFEAYLDNTLTLGRKTIGATGDTDGTLTLGSNSTLDILSGTGDVVIGFNQSNSDTVSGELNALESGATVNLDFDDLIVGHADGTGLAQGTLRWNQEEAIHANEVYFGLGSNATSVLDVPAGGTFRLGTDLDRAGFLNVAYNDTGAAGTLTAGLDFTVTNPTFEAYLDNTLTLGRKTIGAEGDTDGTLTLGSNSTLDIQSVTGDVVIGFNQSNSDTVTGEFNALESGATVNLDIDNLFVGHAERTGTAQGTLRWNQEEAIHANGVWFGLGSNATSVLDVPAGGTLRLGTDIDRIGTLNVAYNDTSAAGTLTAGLDFTVTNPTFEAYLDSTLTLGQKTIGATGDTDAVLTLGSNSTLDIQSNLGDVVIGLNQSNSDTVTGEFNALDSGATVNLDIDSLAVGHANGTGSAQGTLRWNQQEAIHANSVTFGRGSNAISVLDVPAGGTFRLGTDIDRIGTLNLAINDTAAAGTLSSALDFTVTNPTFEAYLDSTLTVGEKTNGATGDTDALLTLGSNSTLDIQSGTGDVILGVNRSNSDTVTGELNALESGATVNLDIDDLVVGHANSIGPAQGTLRWNQEEAIHANDVWFGRGSNAVSVLDVPAGGIFRLGTDIDRIGTLSLAYNDTAAAGTLSSALDFTVTNPTFEAYLDSTLTLGQKTIGATGDTDAVLTLGSNSTLDIQSNLGDVILGFNQSNSDTVTGEFNALDSGATVNLDIDSLAVGHANGTGSAQGTLRWNQQEAIHANSVTFGRGSNAISVLDVPAGGTFRLGTDIDRIGTLNLAINDTAAAGTLSSALDFTVTNPTFEAYLDSTLTLGQKTIGATGDTDAVLTLGSNSTLDIQSNLGDVILGFNQSNSDTVTGEFNALDSGATVNLDIDSLAVGHANGTGSAQGTLRWNQQEAIHANSVTFGRGSNAISVLDVPAGGTFRLGSDIDRIGTLNLAINDTSAAGSLTAELDFTVTNPTFEAYLDSTLTLGQKTIGATGDTDAVLTLGSNSTLDIQSNLGDVILGVNQSNSDTVTGELNATRGVFIADIDQLNIGLSSGSGAANGTFTIGDSASGNNQIDITANQVSIGSGSAATGTLTFLDNFTGNFNADSVNLSNGLFDFGNNTLTIDSGGNILVTTFNLTGGTLQGDTVDYDDTTGTFNFTGGTLSVDTFNGTLDQNGGTLAPGNTPGITTVNGNYSLDFPGTIEIELNGATTVGVDYDQLQVNGAVNLNADAGAGGTLDVVLGFTPTVGDSFTIIDNDANDLIVGFFDGLPQLGTFDVVNGADTVTFTINYAGGDDNDVVLEATAVNPTATATALAIDDTGTQGPMTLARSGPIVELVPDEDVLVFTNSTSDPLVADVKDPAAPPVFAMYVGLPATVGITKEEFSVDDTEQGIDPGLIDDLDLIGMPGESGLSHDLYV